MARQGDLNVFVLAYGCGIVFAVTYLVVFFERGQRRIVVNYAKRQQGRQGICCSKHAFTTKSKHGGCYSTNLC